MNREIDHMDEPRYNIRAVERLTGVPAPTLRSWERRYGFPVPERTGTARRLYSERQVEAIRWMKAQTLKGLSVAQAVRWAQQGGATVAVRAGAEPSAAPQPDPNGRGAPNMLVRDLIDAAVRYDEAAAEAVLSTAFGRYDAGEVLTDVITPALIEIGERWAQGALPVTVEHFASNMVRRRLFALLGSLPVLVDSAPRVLLACVRAESHDIGLLMLALFLRWSGTQPVYLGADVPVSDLVGCVHDSRAALICLSAVTDEAGNEIVAYIDDLRRAGVDTSIVAGGHAAGSVQLPADIHRPNGSLPSATRSILNLLSNR